MVRNGDWELPTGTGVHHAGWCWVGLGTLARGVVQWSYDGRVACGGATGKLVDSVCVRACEGVFSARCSVRRGAKHEALWLVEVTQAGWVTDFTQP